MAKLTSSLVISVTDRVSGPARGILGALRGLRHQADGFNRNQMAMASGLMANLKGLVAMAAAYASVTQGIQGTIGAAIKFEDSMADIRKVVDFKSPQQFKQVHDDLLKLSTIVPLTASQLAEIYSAGGQANIPTDELLKFTEMTSKVATAWDTTAAETGDALAKIRTALSLTVDETGLVADAINFLGNASASGTKDLLKFSRGLNSGKLAGFAAKETLAFGAAMISSGFEAEVAETSFRNMARVLTSGTEATKGQRTAFRKLGFDHRKVAKAMQKDAVGTTLKVLNAIKKLPAHEQGAIATALFGQEARAIPALLNNLPELQRLLGLVAEDSKYAGSAQQEFEVAMQKTSATLGKLKNNIARIGISIGEMALPTLNDWASTLSSTLSTLDQRVTIFDKLGKAAQGFMSGLGFDGGTIGEQFGKLYDTIFGRLDTFEKDTDRLGAIFGQFRQYGADVRAFGEAVGQSIGDVEKFFKLDAGTIGDTLGTLGSSGFKLAAAAVGITMVAGALGKLSRALLFLTGVSTVIGGAKGIAKLLGAFGGLATGVTTTSALKTVATKAAPAATNMPGVMALLSSRMTLWSGALYTFYRALDDIPHAGYESASKNDPDWFAKREAYRRQFGGIAFEGGMHRAGLGAGPKSGDRIKGTIDSWPEGYRKQSEAERYAAQMRSGFGERNDRAMTTWFDRMEQWWNSPPERHFPGKEADDAYTRPVLPDSNYWLDQIRGKFSGGQQQSALGDLAKEVTVAGTVVTQPSGVQQVSLTNPPQPNVYHVSAPVTVHEAANGAEVARQFASSLKTAISGTHADMNHQAHA